jgi:hypothetical protein
LSLRGKIASAELRDRIGVDPIGEVCRRNRLMLFGHMVRKKDDDWVKMCTQLEVEGMKSRGKPRKTWKEVLHCKKVPCQWDEALYPGDFGKPVDVCSFVLML